MVWAVVKTYRSQRVRFPPESRRSTLEFSNLIKCNSVYCHNVWDPSWEWKLRLFTQERFRKSLWPGLQVQLLEEGLHFIYFLIQFCTYLVLLLQVLSEQDKNHKSGTNKVTYNWKIEICLVIYIFPVKSWCNSWHECHRLVQPCQIVWAVPQYSSWWWNNGGESWGLFVF